MNPFLNIVDIPDGPVNAARVNGIEVNGSSRPNSGGEFEKLYNENVSGTPEPKPLDAGDVSGSMPEAINVIPGVTPIEVDAVRLLNVDALTALPADNGQGILNGREAALLPQSDAGTVGEIFPGSRDGAADEAVLRALEQSAGDVVNQRADRGNTLLMRGIADAETILDQASYAPSRSPGQATGQIGPDPEGALLLIDEKVRANASYVNSEDSGRLIEKSLNIREVKLTAEAPAGEAANNVQSGPKNIAPESGRQIAEPEGAPTDDLIVPRTDSRQSMMAGGDTRNPESGLQKNETTSSGSLLNHATQGADKVADTGILTGTGFDVNKIGSEQPEIQPSQVRFVLPDNIDGKNISNNRTIFIKLEPEHLGTVRLTLSSHSSGITGRLVVDTAAVQSVVESNLNSLFDELVNKGINLDSFQVSVGGGHIGQRFSPRQAAMGSRHHSRWSNGQPEIDGAFPISAGGGTDRLYINATGVNWLA